MIRHNNFVPNDTAGTRKDTAILLVGTAREFGIHQRSIRMTSHGFLITDELATVLYDEAEEDGVEPEVIPEVKPDPKPEVHKVEPDPEPTSTTKRTRKKKASTKTSGDRAEKNNYSEEE